MQKAAERNVLLESEFHFSVNYPRKLVLNRLGQAQRVAGKSTDELAHH